MKVKAKIFVGGDPVTKKVFLTSGFQAPFQEGDLLKQIDVNSHFQSYATGGSIMHLFTAEEMKPEEQERLTPGDTLKGLPTTQRELPRRWAFQRRR